MKILLTNDDGYDAENIKNLYEKLSEDHEVWIVAPKHNCSGMSAAISYLKEIDIEKISEKIYAVDGTPADCTYFGLLSIFDFEFDIVISGINHGANIGNDVLYSGTVGAAIGGRNLKYPPIAISIASYEAKDIDFIAKKSVEMINTIIKNHNEYKGMVININFPDIDESEYKGIKGTAISKRGIPAKPIPIKKNNGLRFRYNYSGEPLSEDHETDAQAVKDGFVSVSALDYSLNSRNSIDNLSNIFNE
jgi:5'-nucleotidase